VSSAARVPETYELTGDDARKTLMSCGRWHLVRDAFVRFRASDGFSHARSLAFTTSLVLVQGLIVVVGFAAAFEQRAFSAAIVGAIQDAAPGPAGEILIDAVKQARNVAESNRFLPLFVGLIGLLVTGTTTMGQLERGLNRMYGIEQDRPSVQKYGRAFVLAVSAGLGLAVAFTLLAFGRSIRGELGHSLRDIWFVLQWPVALALAVAAVAKLFRSSPNRRQPAWSWLAFGAFVGVGLWGLITICFGLMFRVSDSFGDTYGALAGIVALQLWCLLSAIAILLGGAIAAQLEAVRAGVPTPRRERIEAATDGSIPLAPVRD
jgi:YihY family inner membrane protein